MESAVVMRKFLSVAAVTAALAPGVALAHDGAPSGSTAADSSGEAAGSAEEARRHMPWDGSALTTQFSANIPNMLNPPAYPSTGSLSVAGTTGIGFQNPDCQNQSGVGGNV